MKYFNDHAFESLGTENFVKYLKANLTHKYVDIVSDEEVNEWIYEQGLPSYVPKPQSSAFTIVDNHINQYVAGTSQLNQLPTTDWTLHEWLHFINNLPLTLSLEQMKNIDAAFNLTQSNNAEIAHAWYLLSLRVGYDTIYPALSEYLISIGRRKLIVPLYQVLSESEEGKAWVKEVYEKARPGYHPLAQGTVDGILNK